MEVTGAGKSPNATLSFRYNANNEELEELFQPCDDDPPTPQSEPPTKEPITASPKRADKTSIIDKYFKNIRTEKPTEKQDDPKLLENKHQEETRNPVPPKEASSSPVKDYLKGLGKKSTSEVIPEVKESGNETWKIFHDFKFKIAQAVEDMKTRSVDETKEKLPPESSTSDSEENSAIKDIDQQSVGDTDNQVSSLDSSIQNLSEMTQPLTAKPAEREPSLSANKIQSSSSEDTHKNIENNDLADVPRDDSIEIESGVEALEDTIDAFGDVTQLESETQIKKPLELAVTESPIPTTDFNFPPSKNDLHNTKPSDKPKSTPFTFTMYFLTIFLILNYFLFPNSDIWIGFLLGIWVFCFTSYCKHWFLDNYFSEWEPGKSSYFQMKTSSVVPITYTIPSVKEHRPMKKYEGWINHYRFPDYDPHTYHINKTTTAFIKLEGCNLRISYTRTKVAKRALWDEKIDNVTFYQHRLYNLTGARIILLPKGLVSKRQWSKKYPICIILNEEEKIQVLEKENATTEKKIAETEKKTKEQPLLHETESAETNTSPEKKKKFVWRRREKSISQSEVEPEKEGLRHRLVRKMHRDKRSDSISACADPDAQVQTDKTPQSDDSPTTEHEIEFKSACSTKEEVIEEELDESELSRIKEFLDEAELDGSAEGAAEGEWSLQVKQSKDKHSHLFLFARTGRDKHEWFRRLNSAISEANASNDSSTAEDKPTNEQSQETKDGVELAVYKSSEKDTVTLTKNKTKDSVSEGASLPTTYPLLVHANSYEKSFWSYLFKIMQGTGVGAGGGAGGGAEDAECECRLLPGEVAWVNTVLARLMFDVMRDPAIIARLQARIQRKLNTLKLPSFMSPLVVTELSLAGACPLVRRVAAPACDERGVWLDADLRYDGGAYIAISTQINLMKLKEKNVTLEDQLMPATENVEETEVNAPSSPGPGAEKQFQKRKPAIYDSDVEDSAESSSDDESPPVQPDDSGENLPPSDLPPNTAEGGGSSKKKFLRMVDKIATNKYFQQVTDYKYVKRAMEGLSNTDIKLQLEVNGLEGRLALNLPSPPHDRLWIGFRTNPQLVLRARPAVGARAVRFAHISNWIEQKLTKEFEKVLVLPNMEDISVDLMTPTPVQFE